MNGISIRRAVAAVPIAVLVVSACTSAPSSTAVASASPSAPAGGAIAVTLQEWAVVPASASTAAGEVTFQVTNTGPEDVHEFVVLKTDLGAGALPTDDRGAVTETGAGIEVIGEIEDVAVGASQDLTVTLEAGKYVLLCNIYDETEKEAHYKMGMRTPFEVTG
jgi:iron uptake system component EfeO